MNRSVLLQENFCSIENLWDAHWPIVRVDVIALIFLPWVFYYVCSWGYYIVVVVVVVVVVIFLLLVQEWKLSFIFGIGRKFAE